ARPAPACFLLFAGHLAAAADRRAQDVAEGGAAVGGAVFAHRLALLLDLLALDGQGEATGGAVHGGDAGVDLLTDRELLRLLVATVAGELGAADEAGQDFLDLHLDAVRFDLRHDAGDDVALADAVEHFGG